MGTDHRSEKEAKLLLVICFQIIKSENTADCEAQSVLFLLTRYCIFILIFYSYNH